MVHYVVVVWVRDKSLGDKPMYEDSPSHPIIIDMDELISALSLGCRTGSPIALFPVITNDYVPTVGYAIHTLRSFNVLPNFAHNLII